MGDHPSWIRADDVATKLGGRCHTCLNRWTFMVKPPIFPRK